VTAEAPGGSDKFSGSFTFRNPDLNLVQRFLGRREKALEYAGYIGDFHVDLATGKITYSSRW